MGRSASSSQMNGDLGNNVWNGFVLSYTQQQAYLKKLQLSEPLLSLASNYQISNTSYQSSALKRVKHYSPIPMNKLLIINP